MVVFVTRLNQDCLRLDSIVLLVRVWRNAMLSTGVNEPTVKVSSLLVPRPLALLLLGRALDNVREIHYLPIRLSHLIRVTPH